MSIEMATALERRRDLHHQLGTCHPSCSPECYQVKIRSLAFALPASFQAAR